MARITRKELKTDKFALEVEQTVTYFEEHAEEVMRYGAHCRSPWSLLVVGIFCTTAVTSARFASRHWLRAIQMQEASIGAPTPGSHVNFPTLDAKGEGRR